MTTDYPTADIECPHEGCGAMFDDPWRADEHITYDHDDDMSDAEWLSAPVALPLDPARYLRAIGRMGAVAILAVTLAAVTAVGASPAAYAGPDERPGACHVEGNRVCGVGTPMGPRGGECPEGGRYGQGGRGPTCSYGSGGSSSGGSGGDAAEDAPPLLIDGINTNVPPLPRDYPQVTYCGSACYPSTSATLASWG